MVKHLLLAAVLIQSPFQSGAQSGSISGRILAAGNVPAANVRVAAMAVQNAAQAGEAAMMSLTQTDGDGHYRLENIPAGRYYIAVGPVEAPAYFPGVTVQSRATVVTVAAAAIVDLNFIAELQLAQLQTPPARQTPRGGPATLGARPAAAQYRITVFDKHGKQLSVVPDAIPSGIISISPDGKRVAAVRNGDIWTFDLDTGMATQITSDRATESNPAWSPDGKRIAYFSNRQPNGVYARAADGTGNEELLYAQTGIGLAWSSDRFVSMAIGNDLFALPISGPRTPLPLVHGVTNPIGPRFSPDGRFVVYALNRNEIYVQEFDPVTGDPPNAKKWKISTQGGVGMARWRADGKELFYLAPDRGVMAAPVSTTPEFSAGTPQLLFRAPMDFSVTGNPGQLADVSADGERFAFLLPAAANAAPPPASLAPPCPPPILSFQAGAATVDSGQATTLSWEASNVSSVTIEPEIGKVAASGNREIRPKSSVTYVASAVSSCSSSTVSGGVRITVRP